MENNALEPLASEIKRHPLRDMFIVVLTILGISGGVHIYQIKRIRDIRVEYLASKDRYYDLAEYMVNLKAVESYGFKQSFKQACNDIYGANKYFTWEIPMAILCLEQGYRHYDNQGKLRRITAKGNPGYEFVGGGSLLLKKGTTHIRRHNLESTGGYARYMVERLTELCERTGSLKAALLVYSNNSPTYPDRIIRIAKTQIR